MIQLYLAMLAFMSRLPVRARWYQSLDVKQYVNGIVTFPLVGLLLGSLAGVVFLVLQPGSGTPLAAFFAVLALAVLTGGFHLDGLADTCDAVFSARSRERMLEIMKDSRLGTHGALGLVFILLAKVLVINELALRGQQALPVLASACLAGRSVAVLLMYRQRYARENGLGNLFIGKVNGLQTLVTLGAGMLLASVLLSWRGLVAFIITAAVVFVMGQALKRTLGGQTGDTLGAAIETGEVIFLLALL
ncbi:cobalamin synthase [Mangrovibacter sp. MFB070]|uniref:adenosylcobinamide-GDP ribazoletransferase n=1 Tax=Mangrovibacter sp. MFB070 TaxID=1224318 RepID=UPI0004D4C9D7|nr:adenosylcobinamide-GDP ribazoletransferase [Mangrovibacter sp. MFB070]KEA50644.1 cobalamin synthase [Mangrovibacter sp. MFB070]